MEHTQLGCLTGVGGLQAALDFELDAALAEYVVGLDVDFDHLVEIVALHHP